MGGQTIVELAAATGPRELTPINNNAVWRSTASGTGCACC